MDTQTLTLILSTFAVLLSMLTFYLLYSKQDTRKNADPAFTTRPLQLQAYERLVILTERVALPNIVSRANQPGITAREMQLLMLESIKQEFEYNLSLIHISEPTRLLSISYAVFCLKKKKKKKSII